MSLAILHGVGFVLGADDDQHRAEDFLARDGHVVGDIGEDGRAHVEAGLTPSGRPGPPATSVAPSSMPFWIRPWILSHWMRDTTGPMVVPSARGSPTLVLSARLGDRRDLLHLRQRHEHARRCVAGLAGVVEHVHHAAGDGLGEVGVVEDDVRRLAAELLATRLTVGAARLATSMPARVEPVKEIMSISGCSTGRRRRRGQRH